MTRKERQAAAQFLHDTYRALARRFDALKYSGIIAEIFQVAQKQEKEHRTSVFAPATLRRPLSVNAAAQYFTLRNLADYLVAPQTLPTLDKALSFRRDVLLSALAVAAYGDELRAFFTQDPERLPRVLALDYEELVSEKE